MGRKPRWWLILGVALALSVALAGTASASTRPRCTIHGTPGNDVLRGTAHRDVICAGAGNDVVRAGALTRPTR